MNPVSASTPPVVAVVVTHAPGDGFDEVIASLAAQDHGALDVLFLDTAGVAADLATRVAAVLPKAFVRPCEPGTPFGRAANEVLRLVSGSSGFFLLMHDDVAFEPTAVRLLVEEAVRSNGGVVGPKLVQWDAPNRIDSVGADADKFGELAPVAEIGELDQEQHDAVRDVFALSGAALLARADLFRTLGGFDEAMDAGGEDLDLCWRAHLAGARVIVVPDARARHRGGGVERFGDRDIDQLREQHRLRSVAGNYGALHLARVLPQQVVVTVFEVVAALVTGRWRRAKARLAAWPAVFGHPRSLLAKRAANRQIRSVHDDEVRRLQLRGSAPLRALLRGPGEDVGRPDRFGAAVGSASRRLVHELRVGAHRGTITAWAVVAAVLLVGTRGLLTGPIPAVGDLLAFGPSAGTRSLLAAYRSGWWPSGLGASRAVPTAIGLFGALSVPLGGAVGLLRTLFVLGPLAIGPLGAWRLARPFDSRLSQSLALVGYAFVPVATQSLQRGQWAGLLAYGAAPWLLARLCRLSGIAPFGPDGGEVGPGVRLRPVVHDMAVVVVLSAIIASVEPLLGLVALGLALAMLLGSLIAGGLWGAGRAFVAAVAATMAVLLLLLPWSARLVRGPWFVIGGRAITAGRPVGAPALLRFSLGSGASSLAFGFAVAVLAAVVVARGAYLGWAVRSAIGAMAVLALAFVVDRRMVGSLDSLGGLVAPAAALGVLAIASGAASFDRFTRGRRLGWRHLAAMAGGAAVLVGSLPLVSTIGGGRWDLPKGDWTSSLATLGGADDQRILWVGDPAAVPLPGWPLASGVVYALSTGRLPTFADRWVDRAQPAEQLLADALASAATGRTDRLGRMVAPMGVRYIVVPQRSGPRAVAGTNHPAPAALVSGLAGQLDLRTLEIDDAAVVYENTSWIPARSLLTDAATDASREAGFEPLVRTDLSGSGSVLGQGDAAHGWVGPVDAGRLFVASPADPRWHVTVDGKTVAAQPAFGWANAYDIGAAGVVHLDYRSNPLRLLAIGAQGLGSAAALVLCGRRRPHLRSRRRARRLAADHVEPVLHLDSAVRGGTDGWEPIVVAAEAPERGWDQERVDDAATVDEPADDDERVSAASVPDESRPDDSWPGGSLPSDERRPESSSRGSGDGLDDSRALWAAIGDGRDDDRRALDLVGSAEGPPQRWSPAGDEQVDASLDADAALDADDGEAGTDPDGPEPADRGRTESTGVASDADRPEADVLERDDQLSPDGEASRAVPDDAASPEDAAPAAPVEDEETIEPVAVTLRWADDDPEATP